MNKKLYYLIIILYFIIIKEYAYYKSFFYILLDKIKKRKSFLIEVDVSGSKGIRGPSIFIKGLKELLPYNTSNCIFVAFNNKYSINRNNKSNYFFFPTRNFKEKIYNQWVYEKIVSKLIMGPIFVPTLWNAFPNKNNWYERKFPDIIKQVKGIAVHSIRVRNYLAQRSNTTNLIKKYKIIRSCTNLTPKKIKPFHKRAIDILFFEKYADLDRRKQANQLLEYFNNNIIKIEKIVYGNYTKKVIENLANNSQFIIYFSFYDTGAIGLKEIQNYGVFAFTHQKDFVFNKDTTFFIPELADKDDMKKAYKKIIEKVKKLKKINPNSKLIAKKNQKINHCHNSLDDLCLSLDN